MKSNLCKDGVNLMKCDIVIIVRTASTRLPKKALLKIDHTPMILKLINRLNEIKNAKILICTTTAQSDNELVSLLKKNGLAVFRGSNKNILKRLSDASIKHKIKQCIIVEADDLFCDPEIIKKTCKQLTKTDKDIILWKNLPFGIPAVGLKLKNLKNYISKNKIKTSDTGWKEMLLECNMFKVKFASERKKELCRPDIRLTIDYKEDYELAKTIYRELGQNFDLKKIIKLIDNNTKLSTSNKKIQKKI